jgi:hypothetical protein
MTTCMKIRIRNGIHAVSKSWAIDSSHLKEIL